MRDEMTIREFQTRFNAGEFDAPDVQTQIKAGWYDWFCRDTALARKTKTMGNFVAKLYGGKVDLDRNYVFFKNNCPMIGPLYDSFSICKIENGDVRFFVSFNDERLKEKYNGAIVAIFDVESGKFDEPAFTGSRKDAVNFLNDNALGL